MLIDTSTLSPEKAAIQAEESELRQNINGAWACMALAILFAVLSGLVQETSGLQGSGGFLAVMMTCVALIFAGLSVMAWCFVSRDRSLLRQLREVAYAMATQEPGRVWPPPPSIPTE